MAAQHAARYSDRDSRRHLPSLPSIKELNFSYRPPDAAVQSHPTVDSVPQERFSQQWARAPVRVQQPHPQQQHTPPLSAGHEMSPKVMEYTQKHDSAGYLTPGIPLSAQVAPIPGAVTTGTRTEDLQAHQKRRSSGSASVNVTREVHPIHVTLSASLLISLLKTLQRIIQGIILTRLRPLQAHSTRFLLLPMTK